ncbi:platelet-activating factor acetylhydrolase 2, cytoplasmic-like [Mya arenaria]|uniref:platelet-activating factor acetylhydrolase 2, cytoplasmic-like n=1 Tax=Mya arenaria TaxID=6604 RepID=UPI0022E66F0F|nr:platelet-activating factor acetylhydrolase 2, cytoplasmic-like [Mya arenaria]XP_052764493.1 platelet-activating factor acetylhydrolase 2, cytoplasmic-like [Mya arenaria]
MHGVLKAYHIISGHGGGDLGNGDVMDGWTTARAVKGIERRLHHVTTCISLPMVDSDDEANSDEDDFKIGVGSGEDSISHSSASSDDGLCVNTQSNDNKNPINGSYELLRTFQNDDIKDKPENVRKHLPPGSGPHSVGCLDIMEDNCEEGTFFRIFYPTEKTDIFSRDTQWPLWLPRKQYGHGYAKFLRCNPRKLAGKFFNWLGGDVYIPVLWQAPVLAGDRKFPLVVFSHGLGGNRTAYSTYCTELASQGFVVAALEHKDGSASMTYHLKDNMRGSVVETDHHGRDSTSRHGKSSMPRSHSCKEEWQSFEHVDNMGINWDDYHYRNRQLMHRAGECSRVLDMLTSINAGQSVRNFLGFHFNLKQFKGRLDLDRASVIGHSFGATTVAAALAEDTRFRLGIMLDAWMHPANQELCEKITQPVLLMQFEKFQWEENARQLLWLKSEKAERRFITLRGACHQAVSDFQFLVNKYFGKFMDVRCEMSPKLNMELIRRGTFAFLVKHLDLDNLVVDDDVLCAREEHVAEGVLWGRAVPPVPPS